MASLHKRKAKQHDSSHVIHGRMELDSHADTIVLGSNAIVMHYTSRECDVSPYADTYQPIVDVPIVTGATAVTSPQTGLTYILVFNEAIWMGDILDHSLINPNQLRAFGIAVQDNPYSPTAMHIAAETDDFLFPMSADFSAVTAQELSERWFIGLTQAHETIRVTGSAVLPLSRRYRADRIFEKPLLRGEFYTDTMDGRCKSINGNRYAQVFANKDFFAVAFPLQSKSGAGDACANS